MRPKMTRARTGIQVWYREMYCDIDVYLTNKHVYEW